METTVDIAARVRADLQRAQLVADKARAALASAEAQVAELTMFLRTLERYVGPGLTAAAPIASGEHDKNQKGRVVPARGTASRILVDACMEVIREAGRPLTIGELVDACMAQGLKIGGTDLKSNLAGYLSRDPRVRSLGRNIGWVIVGTEEAASTLVSQEAASSLAIGGSDGRPAVAFPVDETSF